MADVRQRREGGERGGKGGGGDIKPSFIRYSTFVYIYLLSIRLVLLLILLVVLLVRVTYMVLPSMFSV